MKKTGFTLQNILNRLVGSTSAPSIGNKRKRTRILRIEELEEREMLSVTLGDFAAIKTNYADLGLTNFADYNIIEVGGAGDQAGGANNNFDFSDAGIRAAINMAGTTTGNDLIVVRTTATENTITLIGWELVVNIEGEKFGGITIVSLGSEKLTIDANGQSRVFGVYESNLALAGLMITGGNANNERDGGGIYNYHGSLTISNCIISGNTTSSSPSGFASCGGGIYNNGMLTLTDSTISGNTATGTPFPPCGGGIYSTSTLTLANCTISENTSRFGGGVYSSGTLTIIGGKIVGNSASFYGGGIYSSGELEITDCIISENTVSSSIGSYGGGVYSSGEMALMNCIGTVRKLNYQIALSPLQLDCYSSLFHFPF